MSATDLRARIDMWLVAAVFGGAALSVSAQTVTEADLARARQVQPTITDVDIARARQRQAKLLEQLDTAPVPVTPNLDALPQPQTTAPLDLGAVAEGYARQLQAPRGLAPTGPTLTVFVSLSMPEPALRRVLAQAARTGATVTLRGLVDGSLRQTVARTQALIGSLPVAIQIDPRPFDRYGIERVPAVVLARGPSPECSGETCAAPGEHVVVYGDVSLDYALAYIQRSAPAWHAEAATFLARLEPAP